jgi:hypothetical protein
VSSHPPTISDFIGEGDKRKGLYGPTTDPAKFVIDRSRFLRPTLLVPGGPTFEWPLGVEGIRVSGSAQIAEHKFIGDDSPSLQVTHLDDRRITLTGQFPGLTGSQNIQDILKVITYPAKDGKVLTLPAIIFPTTQLVMVENYDFDHPEDERTQTWNYTVTMRFMRTGKRLKKDKFIKPPHKGGKKKPPKGKSTRVFTVHAGANTLRYIAKIVYGNANRWHDLYSKNEKKLNALRIPLHNLPNYRLPLGMKLNY